jgi:hypothetical protein
MLQKIHQHTLLKSFTEVADVGKVLENFKKIYLEHVVYWTAQSSEESEQKTEVQSWRK